MGSGLGPRGIRYRPLGNTGSGRAVAGFAVGGGTGVYGQTSSGSGSGVALNAGNASHPTGGGRDNETPTDRRRRF